MSRIASIFADPRHKALIAYVTMGYPNMEETLQVVPRLASCGCDAVELGIPFSDPLADGATIQEASHVALQGGVTPQKCLEEAARLRDLVDVPLLFMTYFNPVLSFGPERFCRAASKAGIDGLIITDMPPEEGEDVELSAVKEGLDLVYLLAPTSTEERVRLVTQRSRGFIYLVSVTGVTGARKQLPEYLEQFVARVKKVASQPLCVGFGISSGALARRAARVADGVVVGSRLVQFMRDGQSQGLESFVKGLRGALDNVGQPDSCKDRAQGHNRGYQ
ncbi:MAG: tryptophan synthase subunit alpha [Chloroflexota bacterium]